MPRTQAIAPQYRRIYRQLSGADLCASGHENLLLDDLGLGTVHDTRGDLLFGTYTREGLEHALRAYGLLQCVEERRLGPLELRVSQEDPFRARILVWSRRFHAPVADVALRQCVGAEVGLTDALSEAPLLYLDGLLLQHPGRRFDWNRPPLPGQSHPGLALANELLQVLLLMARRIGAEGLALTPATFAAACVYDRLFTFVDGAAQGRFLALRRAGWQRPRWLLAWAVELDALVDAEGRTVRFAPAPMLAPLSRRMAHHLDSRPWKRSERDFARQVLHIDEPTLQARFPWQRMPPGPPPERVAELLGYDPLAPH